MIENAELPKAFINLAILLLFIFCLFSSVQAQATLSPSGWKFSLTTGLNYNQVSFTNWSNGGENSLSYQALVTANAVNHKEIYYWEWKLQMSIGHQISGLLVRKTDHVIDLSTLF